MCYCNNCHKSFSRPKFGPRKVLESGFLKPTVYDLRCYESYGEYVTYVNYFYYVRDTFCPKCGKYLGEMDAYWAVERREKASMSEITRYMNYCRAHPEIICYGGYRYPGEQY